MVSKSREYPEGAIRETDEITPLLEKARRGESVKLFSVVARGFPVIATLEPSGDRVMGVLLAKPINYPHAKPGEIVQCPNGRFRLSWRNVPWSSAPDDDGYLFTNYWHAYAYALKIGRGGEIT